MRQPRPIASVEFMRRVIALVLIIAVGLAIGGTYLTRPAPVAQTSDCPSDALRASQQVIVKQTQAMSAQDFQTARGYASRMFQEAVSLPRFTDIISNDYAYLLASPQITFDACTPVTQVDLLVTATFTLEGVTHKLDYAMTNEQGGWFINGASSRESRTLAA